MPSLIQKPARWMFDALGIVSGRTPQELEDRVTPVLDVMQNGIAVAKYLDFEFVGSTGAGVEASVFVAQTFPIDMKFAYLVKIHARNPGIATVVFKARIYRNSSFPFNQYVAGVTANNDVGWSVIGAGAQYWFVPPGFDFRLETAIFTTTAGGFYGQLVQIPAGSKPW